MSLSSKELQTKCADGVAHALDPFWKFFYVFFNNKICKNKTGSRLVYHV